MTSTTLLDQVHIPEFDYKSAQVYCGPHVSERMLRRAVADRRLACCKPGLKTLFTRAQLDAFLVSSVRAVAS